MGFDVTIPEFPTPIGQNLDNWMKIAKPYFKDFNEETMVLGRSVGGPMALRVLEEIDVKVKGTFLVAGFTTKLNPLYEPLVGSFVKKPFDWKKIRRNSGDFFIYQSDNDPFIPVSEGKILEKELGVKMRFFPGMAHFGVREFSELLNDVKSLYER